MRRSILACGLTLALSGATSATAVPARVHAARTHTHTHAHAASRHRAVSYWSGRIRKYRVETRYWQRVMGVPVSRSISRSLAAHSPGRLRHLYGVWYRREHRAFARAHHPPRLEAWRCIHRYEGSWTDGGAPYWGGLQMSLGFQRTYGGWLYRSKGTADHWTPLEQIWTAVRAARSRGFHPWPNTARYCGLM